jgi:hypothetical protein
VEPVRLAVVEDVLGHEGAVVIRVHAPHREWEIGRGLVERTHHQHRAALAHRHAFCPAAGDVGKGERVQIVTVRLRTACVLDHVDFEEPRWWIAPVVERPHWNAAPDGRADTASALALPIDMQTGRGQGAIDGRRADLQQLGLDDRVAVEMAVPLHGIDQRRYERLEAFATDAVTRLPQQDQRLANGFVVDAVSCRGSAHSG